MALLILGAACSNSGGSSAAPAPIGAPTSAPPGQPFTIATSIDALSLPPLQCASPEACPDSIGQLVLSTTHGPRYCTVSLVAADLVLTASHCRPPAELLGAGGVIKGGCWVRWAQSTVGPTLPTSVSCTQIIESTPIDAAPGTEARLDHAFIRLAGPQPGRHLMRLPTASDRALEDQAAQNGGQPISLFVYGIDPQASAHTLEQLQCVVDLTATIPEMKTDPAQTLVLPSCPAKPGFSGGPIIDDRHLIGVISFVHTEPGATVVTTVGTRVRRLPKINR